MMKPTDLAYFRTSFKQLAQVCNAAAKYCEAEDQEAALMATCSALDSIRHTVAHLDKKMDNLLNTEDQT